MGSPWQGEPCLPVQVPSFRSPTDCAELQAAQWCPSCSAALPTSPYRVNQKGTDSLPLQENPGWPRQPCLKTTALILVYYSDIYTVKQSNCFHLKKKKASQVLFPAQAFPSAPKLSLTGLTASHLDCSNNLCNWLGFPPLPWGMGRCM